MSLNAYYRLTNVNEVWLAWDDMKFPAQAINPPGAVSDPTWDLTNIGWKFENAKTQILQMVGQFTHGYYEGSNIYPHIHWTATRAGLPLWRMKYKWYNNGEAQPGWTTIDVVKNVFTWASGSLAQISTFLPIDGTGMHISSLIKIELSRVGGDAADTYEDDVLLDEFDIHFQSDEPGSDSEYSK